jgi:hypothetical protein
MTDHMSTCAQGSPPLTPPPRLPLFFTAAPSHTDLVRADPNSPVQAYKPSKLARLLHPLSSRSDVAGRQDRQARAMQESARRTESESKSWA